MTYWGYHLIFTLPLIALLLWFGRHRLRRAHFLVIAVVALIAFTYTTPWDNYAVWLGIWSFGENVSLGYPLSNWAASAENPDGSTLVGHIPFEEYSFFIIETVLVCLLAVFFLPKPEAASSSGKPPPAKP
ncbi:MAG: lycopene cyclase domain-containing protein [Opitutales bacterium]